MKNASFVSVILSSSTKNLELVKTPTENFSKQKPPFASVLKTNAGPAPILLQLLWFGSHASGVLGPLQPGLHSALYEVSPGMEEQHKSKSNELMQTYDMKHAHSLATQLFLKRCCYLCVSRLQYTQRIPISIRQSKAILLRGFCFFFWKKKKSYYSLISLTNPCRFFYLPVAFLKLTGPHFYNDPNRFWATEKHLHKGK